MKTLVKLSLHQAGSCTQIEKMVIKKGKFKKINFPSTFALIEHPVKGIILFDTGYSTRVLENAKSFPMFIYPLITPIQIKDHESAANVLKAKGFQPEDVKSIILSHFHIDHMGGLKDFPNAKFIFTASAAKSIQKKSGFKALKKAFMPQLLPDDFWQRALIIDDSSLPSADLHYPEFEKGFDLFGDGSVVAVNLPGHATGQIGIFVHTFEKTVLLASDACWKSIAFKELLFPHPLARIFIADNQAFDKTLRKLHQLHQLRPDILIVPTHCEEALCSLS